MSLIPKYRVEFKIVGPLNYPVKSVIVGSSKTILRRKLGWIKQPGNEWTYCFQLFDNLTGEHLGEFK
jgi:hypothetical protein